MGRALRSGMDSFVQGLVLTFLIVGWELVSASGAVSVRLLPSPTEIAGSLWEGSLDGTFLEHGYVSLRRLALGLGTAMTISVPLGLALGMNQLLRWVGYPIVKVLYPMPMAAVIPVVLIFTGLRDSLYITVVALAAGIPIAIATVDAVRQTDPALLESGRVLGASRTVLFRRVLLPAVLPKVMHAAYVAFAVGLIVLITAEILVSTKGLGHVVVLAQRQFRVADMFAAIVVIGVAGMLQGWLVQRVRGRIAKWESEYLRKQW